MPAHRSRTEHDVVIVGGRVAGAAAALLLARRGRRVLVVDQERPGRDTLSTHALMRAGVVQLQRWGVLDRVVAAGTPPVHRVTFRYGQRVVPIDVAAPLYAPRRTVLDRILVTAAEQAGARFRFGVRIQDVLRDPRGRVIGVRGRARGGGAVTATATTTVGADGRGSVIARAVDAPVTRSAPAGGAVLYGYWSGVAADGYEWCFNDGTTGGLIPTNHDQVCVWAGVPRGRSDILRGDREATLHALLADTAPDVARRVGAGRRHGSVRGFAGQQPALLRRPWGPGWALVGDAGYYKDPLTSHGISDALRDAELLVRELAAVQAGHAAEADALSRYEHARDDLSIPFFDTTARVASYDWDLDGLQAEHRILSAEMQRETIALTALDTGLLQPVTA